MFFIKDSNFNESSFKTLVHSKMFELIEKIYEMAHQILKTKSKLDGSLLQYSKNYFLNLRKSDNKYWNFLSNVELYSHITYKAHTFKEFLVSHYNLEETIFFLQTRNLLLEKYGQILSSPSMSPISKPVQFKLKTCISIIKEVCKEENLELSETFEYSVRKFLDKKKMEFLDIDEFLHIMVTTYKHGSKTLEISQDEDSEDLDDFDLESTSSKLQNTKDEIVSINDKTDPFKNRKHEKEESEPSFQRNQTELQENSEPESNVQKNTENSEDEFDPKKLNYFDNENSASENMDENNEDDDSEQKRIQAMYDNLEKNNFFQVFNRDTPPQEQKEEETGKKNNERNNGSNVDLESYFKQISNDSKVLVIQKENVNSNEEDERSFSHNPFLNKSLTKSLKVEEEREVLDQSNEKNFNSTFPQNENSGDDDEKNPFKKQMKQQQSPNFSVLSNQNNTKNTFSVMFSNTNKKVKTIPSSPKSKIYKSADNSPNLGLQLKNLKNYSSNPSINKIDLNDTLFNPFSKKYDKPKEQTSTGNESILEKSSIPIDPKNDFYQTFYQVTNLDTEEIVPENEELVKHYNQDQENLISFENSNLPQNNQIQNNKEEIPIFSVSNSLSDQNNNDSFKIFNTENSFRNKQLKVPFYFTNPFQTNSESDIDSFQLFPIPEKDEPEDEKSEETDLNQQNSEEELREGSNHSNRSNENQETNSETEVDPNKSEPIHPNESNEQENQHKELIQSESNENKEEKVDQSVQEKPNETQEEIFEKILKKEIQKSDLFPPRQKNKKKKNLRTPKTDLSPSKENKTNNSLLDLNKIYKNFTENLQNLMNQKSNNSVHKDLCSNLVSLEISVKINEKINEYISFLLKKITKKSKSPITSLMIPFATRFLFKSLKSNILSIVSIHLSSSSSLGNENNVPHQLENSLNFSQFLFDSLKKNFNQKEHNHLNNFINLFCISLRDLHSSHFTSFYQSIFGIIFHKTNEKINFDQHSKLFIF